MSHPQTEQFNESKLEAEQEKNTVTNFIGGDWKQMLSTKAEFEKGRNFIQQNEPIK